MALSVPELRLVLVGKTGVGKSKSANTILGKKGHFGFGADQKSVTANTKAGCADRFGTKLTVVDTPGIYEKGVDNKETQSEIGKCITKTTPGPHAILLCVRMGRFCKDDSDTLLHFLRYFGKELLSYVIIVFTHIDQWEEDNEEKGKIATRDEYVLNLDDELKKFLKDCNNRYIFFNNRLKDDKQKDDMVKALLELIQDLLKENGSAYYSNDTYKQAETFLKEEKKKNPEATDEEIRDSDSFFLKVYNVVMYIPNKIYSWLL